MPQVDDAAIAAAIQALNPAQRAQLEAALAGNVPQAPLGIEVGKSQVGRRPEQSFLENLLETAGEMHTAEAESLPAQAEGSMAALGIIGTGMSGGLPGAAGLIARSPYAIGGATALAEMARGRHPGTALAEGGLAAASIKGSSKIITRLKELLVARRAAAALNRIGPTAEAAARSEALAAGGTAVPAARQAARVPSGPPSVSSMNRPLARTSAPSAPSVSESPAAPALAEQPSRLGAAQSGRARSAGVPETQRASLVGKQARLALDAAKRQLGAGATPEQVTRTFIDMGIDPDVAKKLVSAAVSGSVLLGFEDAARARERHRKAQRALRSQAEGVIP